ncbi:dihydroneopterin aldolase [Kaistia geumhonensis]|uniref:7,8-dihydroneopterin aldolase n=1 Tax=Kaistia geumhonensis TaxID=410839 RepID=A0ABU0M2D8_9HYPH|nr:dihydroneopterin aldolase [Kaistia geumhonensis]MCX5479670.1 dihydroneopterin aldolase [Kaistia geumhonensis]MDQ0515106.1 dihydroneopterin aldolase [Kaistia geumhonensis]
MTDRILISDLRFFAFHGLLPEEEVLGQRFRIDLSCEVDLREAGISDDMSKSVHYGQLIAAVERVVTGRRFGLIEALAEAIATEIFDTFSRVEAVALTVTKPEAPVQVATGTVAISIERRRRLG